MGNLVVIENKAAKPLKVGTEPLGESYLLAPGSRLEITSADVDLGDVYVFWKEDHLVVETQGGDDFSSVDFSVIDK